VFKKFVSNVQWYIALEIAIRATGLTGEVIVLHLPSLPTGAFTSVARDYACFFDLNPRTHNIDPNQVKQMIIHALPALVGVPYGDDPVCGSLGRDCTTPQLEAFVDAAHAFGCSYKGV